MVVRTVGNNLIASLHESLGHGSGVQFHLFHILCILIGQRLAESDSLSGDHMLQRTTLAAREHGGIQHLGHHLDHAFRSRLAPRILEIFA